MYYEIKTTRTGQDDNGKLKRFAETWIQDAESIIEATHKAEDNISREYPEHDMVSVKKTAYSNIVDSEDDGKYYRVKFNTLTVNDITGKEKKVPDYILIKANDIDNAKSKYEAYIKDWVVDVELESLSETKILEYFLT